MTPMPSILITGANKSLGREATTHTLHRQAAEEISAAPVNVFGAVRTVHAFLPLLRAQKRSVVNV
jgi:NAD(P)-dependent dehydrogenase (short-subunit alcohol dehydrogenase family)